ncbi:MAG: type II toxin-antitoxin system VapC family toxin [Sulfuricaulis sp.]|uniref:type II toxin-antitoxin system tRNA(fMet)-specific endonuclease VapC n=1 Tax=Sulfuricaulis sp. TaxID=2003553 RepID=UPI0034A30A8A
MKYLLDTDVCIYLINKRPSSVLEKLHACRAGDVGVSAVTVAELRYGACKSQRSRQNHEALDLFLAPFEMMMFDESAAIAYGEIRVQLEKAGDPIGPLDMLIAGQAKSLNVVLVTNNVREFRKVKGLKIETWS